MFALPFTVAALLCGTINVAAAPTPPPPPPFNPWNPNQHHPQQPYSHVGHPGSAPLPVFPLGHPNHHNVAAIPTHPHPHPSNPWNPANQYGPPAGLSPHQPHSHLGHPGSTPFHPNHQTAPHPYVPKYAEIYRARPIDQLTPLMVGPSNQGAHDYHYQIDMGRDNNGNLVGSTISHVYHPKHLPMIPVPPSTGLHGYAQVSDITLPPHAAQPGRGHFAPPDAMLTLHGAKALGQGQNHAADMHNLAAQGHRNHQAFHTQQSRIHSQAGNLNAAAHHQTEADSHRGDAQKHALASANHLAAGRNLTGPDPQALFHAVESARSAHEAYKSLNKATDNDRAAELSHQQGHPLDAAHFEGLSQSARQEASRHSNDSFQHHNSATGFHL